MSPRVSPRQREPESSFAEFRSKRQRYGEAFVTATHDDVFWKYLTARPTGFGAQEWDTSGVSAVLFDEDEQRTLSKASGAAGGFLVPQDFDELITSARRARNVIGAVSRVIETDHGRAIPLPAASAHGTASWTAENAAFTASAETFAQVTLNAYKGGAKVIVSEELAQDALDDFDRFLADELGQRLALLEESAFAQGDGTGKPLGVVTSGNGVATVTAPTGATTTFALADFRSTFAALPPAYQANAT